MGLRITTWNVNGIRNPFGYAPWNQKRTYQAMFDTLEADIVIMQEAKIQRKDLTDDMVLVPGWDVFLSLPKDKKGYSGVAIYTRNSKCCPIRAEEGLTGVLCPPKSTTKFRDLPAIQQIGGYPRDDQIVGPIDEIMLDSEGRAVVLEFPAFVLIGVYVPATRDDTRTDFRMGFISILDARIRNLAAMGKQVVLAGDLNIIRTDIDTAGCAEQLRKESMTLEDFLSTPSRRFFNQLLFEGQVIGERDKGREDSVMWDITRLFHPNRQGMFTCWETKKNARPGNFGSRIDYILCTSGLKKWFEDSNIQEGLMGSDHCPVYATMADRIKDDGDDVFASEVMNPKGMFTGDQRLREWRAEDMLPQSAKLLTEFDRRRTIKDMFARKPATPKPDTNLTNTTHSGSGAGIENSPAIPISKVEPLPSPAATHVSTGVASTTNLKSSPRTSSPRANAKRSGPSLPIQAPKKMRTMSSKDKGKPGPAQSTLQGFFRPKTTTPKTTEGQSVQKEGDSVAMPAAADTLSSPFRKETVGPPQGHSAGDDGDDEPGRIAIDSEETGDKIDSQDGIKVFDPIHSKESWSKLLRGKRDAPLCEHGQPCISYVVKKPGINCGRSFYMCSRPLGPSGQKEKNTQWRCTTFIWARNAESKDAGTSRNTVV